MGRILPYGDAMEQKIRQLHEGFEILARSYDHLNIPPGHHFAPESKLFASFLIAKILGRDLGVHLIMEFDDLYNVHPDLLLPIPELRIANGDERFFFTHRRDFDRSLIRRAVPGGYWAKRGEEQAISHHSSIVGFGQDFVFFDDDRKETRWKLFEFRVNPEAIAADAMNDGVKAQAQTMVMCRIRLGDEDEINDEEEASGDSVDEDATSSDDSSGGETT